MQCSLVFSGVNPSMQWVLLVYGAVLAFWNVQYLHTHKPVPSLITLCWTRYSRALLGAPPPITFSSSSKFTVFLLLVNFRGYHSLVGQTIQVLSIIHQVKWNIIDTDLQWVCHGHTPEFHWLLILSFKTMDGTEIILMLIHRNLMWILNQF